MMGKYTLESLVTTGVGCEGNTRDEGRGQEKKRIPTSRSEVEYGIINEYFWVLFKGWVIAVDDPEFRVNLV